MVDAVRGWAYLGRFARDINHRGRRAEPARQA